MRHEQRQRIGALRAPVHEMDREAIDAGRELFKLVQPPFLRPPIEPIAPVGDQLAQVTDVGAMGPAVALQRLWNPRLGQASAQIRDYRVGDANRKRLNLGALLGAGHRRAHQRQSDRAWQGFAPHWFAPDR
jgi:hypothetical protein